MIRDGSGDGVRTERTRRQMQGRWEMCERRLDDVLFCRRRANVCENEQTSLHVVREMQLRQQQR